MALFAKFGIETILWGPCPADYKRMFTVIRDAGFEGVELFQHPDDLPSLEELRNLLNPGNGEHRLELLGLLGGSLDRRVQYLEGWKEPYLYLDQWDPRASDLMVQGYTVAIHPHYFKKISSGQHAAELLKDNPTLKYIPDTAHFEIKREDINTALRKHKDRLVAVHLKAWRPGFGRASALYARGFTELKRDAVKLRAVLKQLEAIQYDKWIVVEQNYTEDTVELSVQACASWLRDEGFLQKASLKERPMPQAVRLPKDSDPYLKVANILSLSLQPLASRNVGQLYQRMAEAIKEALDLRGAAIWSCSELEGVLVLHGFAPQTEPEDPSLTVTFERFEGRIEPDWRKAVRTQRDVRTPLDNLRQQCKCLRLPIRSSWNPHHIRLVVDLFCPNWKEPTREIQQFLASAITRAFDFHVDRIMFSCGADLNEIAVSAKDQKSFIEKLIDLIRERLSCENVGLFITDQSGVRLKLSDMKPGQFEWRGDLLESEQYYEKGDGQLTTDVWQSREPRFTGRLPGEPPLTLRPKCVLTHPRHPNENRVLAMPIVDISGESLGLVRCVNKVTPAGNVCNFVEDDLVVLDHVLQLAIPSLRLRRAAEDEKLRLLLVSHEFKNPVAALIGSVTALASDLKKEKVLPFLDFRKANIDNALKWAEDLRSLVLRSAYFLGRPDQTFRVVPRETKLMGRIVAPTVEKLKWSLPSRNLDPSKLVYDRFESIPPLHVDPDMFQMIFFNLLDNAIKYAKQDESGRPDPALFGIQILTSQENDSFVIRIRDNGIGIGKAMRDRLFEIGVRGPEAHVYADGTGIGLWLVRHLLTLHGAYIDLAERYDRTEFVIRLPFKLAKG